MSRRIPLILAFSALAALLASPGAPLAQAADLWPSPTARPVEASRSLPPQRPLPRPEPAWPGLLWRGLDSGLPAAPAAANCRRTPQAFEIGAGPAWEAQALRRDREARVESRLTHPLLESAAPAPLPLAKPAPSAVRAAAADALAPQGLPPLPEARHEQAPVSAGVVDDNADFGEYLAYRERQSALAPRVRSRDVRERTLLQVQDRQGRPVPDAQVRVRAEGHGPALGARTDAQGRAWLHTSAVGLTDRFLEVEVIDGHSGQRGTAVLQRGQKDRLQVVLTGSAPQRAQLDIAFLIDATGSMADEIDKLKRSMRAVADEIARLPSRPDVCYALVAYRDRGDAFFVRGADFSDDLGAFQSQLAQLQAGGGGDKPEALNEALHTAVHRLSWRGNGTARLLLLVADAMPHLDYGSPPHVPQHDHDALAAAARGIKLFAVGASGLEPEGEYIFRQTAQLTGGRFVFLTYAQAHDPSSGPGRETVHDVKNYSVETLDRLIVRLVREEMAGWPKG